MQELIEKAKLGLNLDRSSWQLVRFGDVAIQQKESVDRENTKLTRYVKGEHMYSEDIHLREWGELTDEYLGPAFIRKFEEGDILYGSRRTYLKKVVVAHFDGITANTTFVMKANTKLIDKRLLPYVMLSEGFTQHSVRKSKGSVNPYINWKDIADYEFLLPPEDQQRLIADLFSEGDRLFEKSLQLLQLQEKAKKAKFNSLLSSSNCVNEYEVGQLLADGPKNGYSPKSSKSFTGVKTVSISAIKSGVFDPEGCIKYADVDKDVLEKYDVRVGDLFVVRGNGNKFICGQAGLSKNDYRDIFYPDLLIRLRFDQKKLLPNFAAYLWNSPDTHRKLISRAKSTNGIWKINGMDIKKHKLKIPSTKVQSKIMDEITTMQSICELAESENKRLQKLFFMLINQVF